MPWEKLAEALRADVERLQSALTAAQQDSERLDWMDRSFRGEEPPIDLTRWLGSWRATVDAARSSRAGTRDGETTPQQDEG
jgi:hypothetical protein